MHREELGEDAQSSEDVAVVFEAVAEVAREERRRRGRHGSRHGREPEQPHGQEDRERESDEQDVADEVERRQQVHRPEREPLQPDHHQCRQMLVVEELGDARLDLRQPVVDDALPVIERLRRSLDEQVVVLVVVDGWGRDRQFWQERDRVHHERDRDEHDQRPLLESRKRSGRVAADRRADSLHEVADTPQTRRRPDASGRGSSARVSRGL